MATVRNLIHIDEKTTTFVGVEFTRLHLSTTMWKQVSQKTSVRINEKDFKIKLLEEQGLSFNGDCGCHSKLQEEEVDGSSAWSTSESEEGVGCS